MSFGVLTGYGFGAAGSGGGGGSVSGAESGVYLNGSNVRLGGGMSSPFLESVIEEMDGFDYSLQTSGNKQFHISPGNSYALGDLDSVMNGTYLSIDDSGTVVDILGNNQSMLQLNKALGLYILGLNTGLNFTIDADNNKTFEANSGNGRSLSLRPYDLLYYLGDIDTAQNGNVLSIDDINSVIQLGPQAVPGLQLNDLAHTFKLGDVLNVTTGAVFTVNTNDEQCYFNVGGFDYFVASAIDGKYKLGDIDGTGNGYKLSIDDTAGVIILGNNNNQFYVDGTTMLNTVGGSTILGADTSGGNTDIYSVNMNTLTGINIKMISDAKEISFTNGTNDLSLRINSNLGFTGTVSPVNSITVEGGIVTAVS